MVSRDESRDCCRRESAVRWARSAKRFENAFRGLLSKARQRGDRLRRRVPNALQATEGGKQLPTLRLADARNAQQLGRDRTHRAPLALEGDREAMRLVAQPAATSAAPASDAAVGATRSGPSTKISSSRLARLMIGIAPRPSASSAACAAFSCPCRRR